jgi:hypothetical protein
LEAEQYRFVPVKSAKLGPVAENLNAARDYRF